MGINKCPLMSAEIYSHAIRVQHTRTQFILKRGNLCNKVLENGSQIYDLLTYCNVFYLGVSPLSRSPFSRDGWLPLGRWRKEADGE